MQYRPRLKIYKGSNGKNTYQPETKEFRSYEHWCYAKLIKGVWVFNVYSYSKTTNGHQCEGRNFLEHDLKVHPSNIVNIEQRESLGRGLFLDTFYEQLFILELSLKRARADKRDGIIEQLTGLRANIARLRKLGAKCSVPVRKLKVSVIETETQRLADQREQNRAARLLYKAKRKALEAEHGAKLTDVSEVSI